MQLWQPYQKFFSKKPQFCHSDSKKGREKSWIFWKENSFPWNCASAHVESICDHPVKNLSSKLSKIFARIPEMMKNMCAFQTKLFLSKMFVWTCTMKFWQAFRNFVAKKTKNFPELQKCWSYKFLNKFLFFIKNDSLATENAVLTTVANNFFWESTHLQLRFRKPRKKIWNFRKQNNFPKNVPMYMYKGSCDHPAKFLSSKLWKNFAGFPQRMKNLCAFQRKYFLPKNSSEHAQGIFGKPSVTLLPKTPKNFPELQNCWSYNFLNKFIFFHQKWFFSNGECNLDIGSQ